MVSFIAERLVVLLEDDPHAIDVGELQTLQGWLTSDQFDRRGVNRRLRAYACGDADCWRI